MLQLLEVEKENIKKNILNYKKRGFSKIKVDGKYLNIDEFPNLNKKVKHDISIIVDRINTKFKPWK